MSTSNFEQYLVNLQENQDNAKLLKLLINIRKEVEWPRNKDNISKLREKGGLKQVVSSLQTSKKGIIDLALSILGNCCLDSRCSRDVITQFHVLPSLNQILKRYPKEDSINGRIFRIIGNLCQHRDQWANVIIEKKPQIVLQIVNFLKSNTGMESNEEMKISEATIIMGLRALRELLNGDTLKTLVKTYGVLKVVGMLLIKNSTTWQENKSKENILINIIKLLQVYSRYRYYHSVSELRTTENGDSIVHLSKILLLAPKQIVKIIMNFLKICQLNSDLPIPEIFDSFIEILQNSSLIKEFNGSCEEYIKCICQLLEHPGNRKNERCGDSIPLLVNILNDLDLESNRKIECCILIIATLNRCKYSERLLMEQIKCNILNVLNDKLSSIVASIDPLTISHKTDKKRKSCFLSRLENDHKKIRVRWDIDDTDNSSSSDSATFTSDILLMRYDHSPGSSSDSEMAMSWTSGLSPVSSPRSQICDMLESDSDDYSPVCSEVDTSDFPLPLVQDEDELAKADADQYSDIFEENDNLSNFESDSSTLLLKPIKIKLVIKIVYLLKTYVLVRPPIPQLATPELLIRLVKCTGYFEWPYSSSILDLIDVIYKIIEFHDNLLPLMQSDFIPIVYDLGKTQHGSSCTKCRQFQIVGSSILRRMSKVAESGVGKGEIAHKLLRGDNNIKQQLALVIPYIIRNKAILVKLMMNCGGFEILLKLFQDASTVQEKSIKVLCVLASKKLRIPNPKSVKAVYIKSSKLQPLHNEYAHVVTFKLDDGSCVKADRILLSKQSDFFSRLLNGDFKESSEDEIILSNVMNKSFKCLLNLIKCGIEKNVNEEDMDLLTHLDVIALCDRFLMQELCVYLTDSVEKSKFNAESIPKIYQWSMESQTHILRVECVAFALVGNIVDADRFKMFKSLFELGYNEELVEDIRKLLVRYMTLNPFCDCKSKKMSFYCDKKTHIV